MFYILACAVLAAIGMCITRNNPVHAIVYLVNSFFSLSLIFYLFGAPLVAAWQLIIYAGAIMVLFLFIIMMLELSPDKKSISPGWHRWGPAMLLSLVIIGCTVTTFLIAPMGADGIPVYYASPRQFGYTLFKEYTLAIEVVSFQLLFAAVGAFYLGRSGMQIGDEKTNPGKGGVKK